jgi:hypothetical protein
MQLQENRDIADLDRLQGQADIARGTRDQAINTGIAALGSAGQTLAGGLVPNKKPEPTPEPTPETKAANTAANTNAQTNLLNLQKQQSVVQQLPTTANLTVSNRYGLKEGGYDELKIGGSGSLLASNEYTPGFSDEADNYYNAYKTWHEETYPGQTVTYAGEGEGKLKDFETALGY